MDGREEINMRHLRTALLTIALAVPAIPAWAHHSAAEYDFRNLGTVEGIVKKFDVVNPHAVIILTVTDDKGTRDVEFEGHSRNNFYRGGWRPDSVKFGDKIKLTYAVRKDGGEGGYVTAFVTATGQAVGLQPQSAGGESSGGRSSGGRSSVPNP
jgi:hypothetical protein